MVSDNRPITITNIVQVMSDCQQLAALDDPTFMDRRVARPEVDNTLLAVCPEQGSCAWPGYRCILWVNLEHGYAKRPNVKAPLDWMACKTRYLRLRYSWARWTTSPLSQLVTTKGYRINPIHFAQERDRAESGLLAVQPFSCAW
jgi:hypothetical protein